MPALKNIKLGGYACRLWLPECCERGERAPAVYLCGGHAIEEIAAALDGRSVILLGVEPRDWGDDLTPWPATALRRGEKDFAGGAGPWLEGLVHRVVPSLETRYPTLPGRSALMGYSLGGLASLYELYTTGAFGRVGCLSGSLWYDDWLHYMQSHTPANRDARVWLSLGRGEKHSRNPRMAQVGYATRRAAELLAGQLSEPSQLRMVWNPGGHFDNIPQRFIEAIDWLTEE